VDFASSSTKPIPTTLAGAIRFDALGDHQLAYSLLLRHQFETDISSNVIEDRPAAGGGTDQIARAYNGDVKLQETWVGLSWAFPVGQRIGLGLSQFVALRNHSAGSQFVAQRADPVGEVAAATTSRRRSYTDYRTFTKLGIAAEVGGVDLGINATTPSINVGGSGLASFNASAAGDIDGDGTNDSFLASNVQPELPTTFETSWSVGAGVGFRLGSTRVHGSAEWYDAVASFSILDADAFTPQTGGGPIENDATGLYESVVNWGVGLEHRLGPVTTLYVSYSQDNSAAAADAPTATDLALTSYDISRYSLGTSFRVGASDLMLGFAWARGFDDFRQLIDLDDPAAPGDTFDGDGDAGLRFSQWTIVVGFELATGS